MDTDGDFNCILSSVALLADGIVRTGEDMTVGTHTVLVDKGLCDSSSSDLADLGTTVEKSLASYVTLTLGDHGLDTAEKTVDDLLAETAEVFDNLVGNDFVLGVGTSDKRVDEGEEAGEESMDTLRSG